MPGWNEYVNSYYQMSIFGHNMWSNNGRPHHGIIPGLQQKTGLKYHHVGKMVLKSDVQIRCDKMAETLVNNNPKGFWKMPTTFKPKIGFLSIYS